MPKRTKKPARRAARGKPKGAARRPLSSSAPSGSGNDPICEAPGTVDVMSCARNPSTVAIDETQNPTCPTSAKSSEERPDPPGDSAPLDAPTSFSVDEWKFASGTGRTGSTGSSRRRRALSDQEVGPWQERFDAGAELGDRVGRRHFADEESNEEADRRLIASGEIPLSALRSLLRARTPEAGIDGERRGRTVVICATPLYGAALQYDHENFKTEFILAPNIPKFRYRSYLNRTRPCSALGSAGRRADAEVLVCSLADLAAMTVRARKSFLGRAARCLVPGGRFALFVPYGNAAWSVPTPPGCGADPREPLRVCPGGEIHLFRRLGAHEGHARGFTRPPHGVFDFSASVFEVFAGWLRHDRLKRLDRLLRDLRRRDLLTESITNQLRYLRKNASSENAQALIARFAKKLVPMVAADHRLFDAGAFVPASPTVVHLLKARFRAVVRPESYRLDEAAWSGLEQPERDRYRRITVHQPLDRLLLGVLSVDLGRRLSHLLSGMCVGGRRGWSPLRTIVGVQKALVDLGRIGRVCWTVVDIANFFDCIPRSRLYEQLQTRLPAETMAGLSTLLGPASGRGLPQGAPPSPILANVYLDRLLDLPLHRWRAERHRQVRFWRYFDDVLIIGASEDGVRAAMQRTRRLIADAADLTVSEKTPPCVHAAEVRPPEYLGLRITADRITLPEGKAAEVRRLLLSEAVPAESKRGLLRHYLRTLDPGFFAVTFGDVAAKYEVSASHVPEEGLDFDDMMESELPFADPMLLDPWLEEPASVTTAATRVHESDSLHQGEELESPSPGFFSLPLPGGQSVAAADAASAPREDAMRVHRARIDSSNQDSGRLSVRRFSPELDHILDLRPGGLIVVSGPIGIAPRFVAPMAHAMLRDSPQHFQSVGKSGRTAFFGPPPERITADDYKSAFHARSSAKDWLYGAGGNLPFPAAPGTTLGWLFGVEWELPRPEAALDVVRYDTTDFRSVPEGSDPPLFSRAGKLGLRRVAEGHYRLIIADFTNLRFGTLRSGRFPFAERRPIQFERRDALRMLLDAMNQCEDRGFPRPTAIVITGGGATDLASGRDTISDERFYADWADGIIMLDADRDRVAATGHAQLGWPPRMCDHWTLDVFRPRDHLRRVVHASQVVFETESRRGRSGNREGEWDWRGRVIDLLGWRDQFPEWFGALSLNERRQALESPQVLELLRQELSTAPPTPQGLRTLQASRPGLLEAGLCRLDGDSYAASLARRLGGTLQPNSGAGRAKGDVRTCNAVIEAKRTRSSSFTLGYRLLEKLLDDRDAETRRARAAP